MQKLISFLTRVDFLIPVALVILFFFYGYHNLLSLEPQSIHQWRQADCASLIWNYYDTNWNLFTPSLHNQVLNNGRTVGEFPILYYISGMLMRLLGPNPWVFRMVNILVVFAGLYAFGKMVYQMMNDAFWAVVIPVLIFASPVLVYYTNTPMPEAPAMGLMMVGWYFFFRFYESESHKHIRWAVAFFALATAIKLSAGISLVAAMAIYFIELNDWGSFKEDRKMFAGKIWRYALYFGIGLLFVVGWYTYADGYSHYHQVRYFLTEVRPISETSVRDFTFVLHRFFEFNGDISYFFGIHLLVVFLLFFCLSRQGRKYPVLFAISLLCFIGVVMYLLLFYQLFNVHDYYLVAMLIAPIVLFVHGAVILKNDYPKVESSWVFRGIVAVVVLAAMMHARSQMELRYYGNKWHYTGNVNLYDAELEPYLASIGVTEDKKVISLPDKSPNATLYLMDRLGWSQYNVRRLPGDIELFKRKGAEFLIINDTSMLKNEGIMPFTDSLSFIGNYKDIFVYDLRD